MGIRVVPLGAGQDVGKSCIVVSVGHKTIMMDCGMHPGFHDARRFPDFSLISKDGKFTEKIDCLIISHFHLDHCGALPFFTQVLGYDGPIYMTHPTKAICPILLEDYRKVTMERRGGGGGGGGAAANNSASDKDKNSERGGVKEDFFTAQHIADCMKKVIGVSLEERVMVDEDFEIRAFYAGHVLGAAMFYIRVGEESIVYTGDFNATPDRHLAPAYIPRLQPDLLITETTYATTIRDSKRCRERDILNQIHHAVTRGGKVLIPVFALGRAQELLLLIDAFWQRMNLKIPVYFAAGLTEKANSIYARFVGWMNERIKKSINGNPNNNSNNNNNLNNSGSSNNSNNNSNNNVSNNVFEFKNVKNFDRSLMSAPGPMVLFATPGMLHGGLSLEVFRAWGGSELNLVIIPGYCVQGTVGFKIMQSNVVPRTVDLDNKTRMEVRCGVKALSFSAHADAKGILGLVKNCQPKNVMLVHGEQRKMGFLKLRIERELSIPCFYPPNGSVVTLATAPPRHLSMSRAVLDAAHHSYQELVKINRQRQKIPRPPPPSSVDAVLVLAPMNATRAVALEEVKNLLPLSLAFAAHFPLPLPPSASAPPPSLGEIVHAINLKLNANFSLITRPSPSPSLPPLRGKWGNVELSEEGGGLKLEWGLDDEAEAAAVAHLLTSRNVV